MEQEKRYDKEDLENALHILQAGGVILYPTDTIWGLGCDATNETAVRRIFEIKQRNDAKAMLVLLDTPSKLQGYVADIPNMAWDLIEYATKPLTIIYPQGKNLAPNLLAEDKSIGIRITNEMFSKTLCTRLRRPIVSTSANISGQPAAKNFAQIPNEILTAVDYAVHFRRDEKTEPTPSSIIKLGAGNTIEIIRQ